MTMYHDGVIRDYLVVHLEVSCLDDIVFILVEVAFLNNILFIYPIARFNPLVIFLARSESLLAKSGWDRNYVLLSSKASTRMS